MSSVRVSELIAPAFYGVHADVRRGEHGEYWLMGGRGSTKSSFVSVEIILGMMRTPGANAIVYRKVAATLRESVYEQMITAINWLGVRDFFAFRLSPMEIRYKPTGQRILFRGADDPGKSKSIKLSEGYFAYLWFEELSEFSGMEDIRTIQASVIRGTPADGRAVTFYTYNPPVTAASWVNEEALKQVEGRLAHASTYLDVPAEWLGKEFIARAEELRATDERAYRHMYLGEVTGTGGNVFTRLDIRRIAPEEIAGFNATYAGLDFGWFPDPAVFVRCCYDAKARRLWVYDEYTTVYTSNIDLFRALVEQRGLTAAEEVIADGAELKSVNDLRSYGMNCVAAMKGPGSRRTSMRWLAGLKEIVIDPARCPVAAKEFREYEYAKTKDGRYVESYPDGNDHAIDAVRYALNRIWMRSGY